MKNYVLISIKDPLAPIDYCQAEDALDATEIFVDRGIEVAGTRRVSLEAWLAERPAVKQKTFVREYVIRIEGTPDQPEWIACSSPNVEARLLGHLKAVETIADEVERFWQVSLGNRKVTVTPK